MILAPPAVSLRCAPRNSWLALTGNAQFSTLLRIRRELLPWIERAVAAPQAVHPAAQVIAQLSHEKQVCSHSVSHVCV